MKKIYLSTTPGALMALLWVCLLMSQITWAQSIPDAQWARVGNTLAITTDGNIVTSATLPTSLPLSSGTARIFKYDVTGNQLWAVGPMAGPDYIAGKLPPGFCPCVGGYGVIERIARTSPALNGGITFVGNAWSGIAVRGSVDATGHYNGIGHGGGFDALITTPDDGSLYVNSYSDYSTSKGLVSIQKTGNPSWTTNVSYPTPAPDVSVTKANAAINTPDGGYLLVGFYNSFGASSPGVSWAAKLDRNGDVSWQKLVSPPTLTNAPGPGDINSMSTITDAIVSADGTGYALVGLGTAYPNINSTVLMEIDFNGNVKPGRAKAIDIQQATNAYITTYTGGNGKKYYAVGNTSLQGRSDPQLLLVDPTTALVATKRLFPGPGESRLIDIATAGDGSLVFVTDNNQLVKLQPEVTPPQPPVGAFALTAPTYNCTTGAFTFNTSGGDGSTIEYMAAGITGWTTNPNQFVDKDSRTASDVKPFTLMARQNGVTVTYVWDLRAYCTGTPPPPPVNPPTGGTLTLLAPTYNCQTGAITFNTAGGDGTTITYTAPGIARSSLTSNTGTVEPGLRGDPKPITITAMQSGQTTSYVFDLGAYCSNPPPPPVNPPTGDALALTTPTYNCTTGAFTFNTSGGNGSPIEYMAAGITGWTTNPNQFVDQGSRTANDVQPFTLSARQSGVTVTYVWNLKVACGRARVAALPEPGPGLQVRVLGNPVINQTAEVEITGAERQALQLNLIDLKGTIIHQRSIQQAEFTERVSVPMGEGSGLFLLNVSTSTQRQQMKLVKP